MPKPRGRNLSAAEVCSSLGIPSNPSDDRRFDVRPPNRHRMQSPNLNQICAKDYTKISFDNCQRPPSPQARGQVGNLDPCELNFNRVKHLRKNLRKLKKNSCYCCDFKGYQPYSSDCRPLDEPIVDRCSQLNLEYQMARNKQIALERLCAEEAEEMANQPRPPLMYINNETRGSSCPLQRPERQQQQPRPQIPAGPARNGKSQPRPPNIDQLFALNLANYTPPGENGRPFDPNRDTQKRHLDVPEIKGSKAASCPIEPGSFQAAAGRLPRSRAPQPARARPVVATSTPKAPSARAQLASTSPSALPSAHVVKAAKEPDSSRTVTTTVTTTTTTKRTVEGPGGCQESVTRGPTNIQTFTTKDGSQKFFGMGLPPPPVPPQNAADDRPTSSQAVSRGTRTVINQQTQAALASVNQQAQTARTSINQQTQRPVNQQTENDRERETPPNITSRKYRDLAPWPEPKSTVVSECEDPGLDASFFKPPVQCDTRHLPTPPHIQECSEASSFERSMANQSCSKQSYDLFKTYTSEASSNQTPPSPIKSPSPSPDRGSPDRRNLRSLNRSRSCVLPGATTKKEFVVHENVVDLTLNEDNEPPQEKSGTSDYCARNLAYQRSSSKDKSAAQPRPPIPIIRITPPTEVSETDVVDLTDECNEASGSQPTDDGSGQQNAGALTIQRHQGRVEVSSAVCQQQPRASLFRCLAKKLSSTYDFLSSMVASQKPDDTPAVTQGDTLMITEIHDQEQICDNADYDVSELDQSIHPTKPEVCPPPKRQQIFPVKDTLQVYPQPPPTRRQICQKSSPTRPQDYDVSELDTSMYLTEPEVCSPPKTQQTCPAKDRLQVCPQPPPTRRQICQKSSPTRPQDYDVSELDTSMYLTEPEVCSPPKTQKICPAKDRLQVCPQPPPTRRQVCPQQPPRRQVCPQLPPRPQNQNVSRRQARPPQRPQICSNVGRPQSRDFEGPTPSELDAFLKSKTSPRYPTSSSGENQSTMATTTGYGYRPQRGYCPERESEDIEIRTDNNLKNLYGKKTQLPNVPENVQECSIAKRCGRVKFDKSDKNEVQDVELANRRKAEIDTLVKDAYCPGIIQETIDGQEDFNKFAIKLTGSPDNVLCKVAPPDDPMTLLEAFSIRIDNERAQIEKDIPEDANQEQIAKLITEYFDNQNPTDLNRSIKSLMISEHLQQREEQETSKGISLEADVQKLVTTFPDNSINKFIFYTGHTKAIAEEAAK